MKLLRVQSSFVHILFLFIVYLSALPATSSAQNAKTDLPESTGRVISEGVNKTPSGELRVTTYRLEVLEDSKHPRTATETKLKAFRLTIFADEYLPKTERLIVWMDHIELGSGVPSSDLRNITCNFYASSLPNGISLGLSRFDDGMASRSMLVEKLTVPAEFADPLHGPPTIRITKFLRTPKSPVFFEIKIERSGCQSELMTSSLGPPVLYWVEIAGFANSYPDAVRFSCESGTLMGRFDNTDFSQIPDGAEIMMNSTLRRDPKREIATKVLGRINKRKIEQR